MKPGVFQTYTISDINTMLQIYTEPSNNSMIKIIMPKMVIAAAMVSNQKNFTKSIIYEDLQQFYNTAGRIKSDNMEILAAGYFTAHLLRWKLIWK